MVVLPAPVVPTSATVCPAGTVRFRSGSTGRSGTYEKCTSSERDIAAHRVSVHRVRRILDARALGEHPCQLLQRRRRGLERVEELRDLLHRLEEHPQVEQERGERADRHLSVQHPVAAVEQHHAGGDVADQLHPRHEDRQQLEGLLVVVAVPVGDVFEDLLVARLPPVCLHGLDAGHRLDELHDHQRRALADPAVRLGRLVAEPPAPARPGSGTPPSTSARAARRARPEECDVPTSVSTAVIRLSKPVSSMSWMASTSLVDRLTTRPEV